MRKHSSSIYSSNTKKILSTDIFQSPITVSATVELKNEIASPGLDGFTLPSTSALLAATTSKNQTAMKSASNLDGGQETLQQRAKTLPSSLAFEITSSGEEQRSFCIDFDSMNGSDD